MSKTQTLDWVEIPKGEFIFGLSVTQAQELLDKLPAEFRPFEEKKLSRETPEKVVKLDTFYISRFPITWKQYMEFADSDHPYSYRHIFSGEQQEVVLKKRRQWAETVGDHPVAGLAWHNAWAFCEWLGARLPTSAEWEKAARGTDGRLYPWGNDWNPSRGNFNLNRSRWPDKSSPVNAYPAGQSPYGVVDMLGNTYEYTISTVIGQMELAIARGCSCDFEPRVHTPDWFRNRVTAILPHSMNGGVDVAGFRPVLDEWQHKYWPGFKSKA